MPRSEEANLAIREGQRENILMAAMSAFARKGGSATMAEVAAEAGVSHGLAYRYFPSKEAILTTLVRRTAESGGGPAKRIKEIQGTPGKRLEKLVSYILDDRRERPEFYRFLYQLLSDEAIPDELKKTIRRNARAIQDAMHRLIVEGQASGEVAKDDPDKLLSALVACLDCLGRGTVLLDKKDSREHFPDAGIVLRMLKPDWSRE